MWSKYQRMAEENNSYPKNVLRILAMAGRVNGFVKKYHTIAIHHEVDDAHPRRTRP
jgi:hypothetical protein